MRAILLPLVLAGCAASPAFEMRGAAQQSVVVEGREYVVFRKERKFEVIRLGYASRAEQAAIRTTMVAVVEQVTGCTAKVAQGDSGEMRGTLSACKK